MIGGTRLGNPVEVMNAPGNEWTWIVWKFMLITVPTMIFLEWGWYQMKVGDLVCDISDGHRGIVVEWSDGGWLVHFPVHNCVFHMDPRLLEKIS